MRARRVEYMCGDFKIPVMLVSFLVLCFLFFRKPNDAFLITYNSLMVLMLTITAQGTCFESSFLGLTKNAVMFLN